jgi:hypothetical protein
MVATAPAPIIVASEDVLIPGLLEYDFPDEKHQLYPSPKGVMSK